MYWLMQHHSVKCKIYCRFCWWQIFLLMGWGSFTITWVTFSEFGIFMSQTFLLPMPNRYHALLYNVIICISWSLVKASQCIFCILLETPLNFQQPMLLTDDFDLETYMLKPSYLINIPRTSCSHTKLAIN